LDFNAFIPIYNQGRTAYQLEHYTEAEKPLKQALAMVERLVAVKPGPVQRKNLAIVTQMVGINAFQLKNYQDAERFLKKSLSLYSSSEFQAESQDAILSAEFRLGQMAMYEGQYAKAQPFYQAALSIASQQQPRDDKQIRQIQHVLNDIAHIDYGPDYLQAMSPKITHWSHPEQDIAIYIEDGEQISGWKPENKRLVQQAYAEWQRAMEARVHFVFVDTPEQADTVIRWMEKPKPTEHENEVTLKQELHNGECKTHVLDDKLSLVDISVAVNDQAGKPYNSNSINNTLLHEIAHSLGLIGGHSSNPSDILFPNNGYEDGQAKHLTARDIQTMHKLYIETPLVTNPAGIHLVAYNRYMDLYLQGNRLYNQKDFVTAANCLKAALGIYTQENSAYYLLASSEYQLKAYTEALPHYMLAINTPGSYRDEALKMAGYTLIKLGEMDDQVRAYPSAEIKYQQAYQLLTRGMQILPVKPETQKNIQDELTWLGQRFAARKASTASIQWLPSSQHNNANAIIVEEDTSHATKKKGWLSSLTSSFIPVAPPTQASY